MKHALLLVLLIALALLYGCIDPIVDPIVDPIIPVVTNRTPIAHTPFTTATAFTRLSTVVYDLRFRYHGCDNGMVQAVSGARDIDGDPLEYRIQCTWSVFADLGAGYELINDRWVSFPIDDKDEQKALVILNVGYSGTTPYYPYAPMNLSLIEAAHARVSYLIDEGATIAVAMRTASRTSPMSCDPYEPYEPPYQGGCNPDVGTWSFVYSVRDPYGATATYATRYGSEL